MIRNICRDPLALSRRAVPADDCDIEIGRDLLDTLTFHHHNCVGMAANMIGINKAIIAVDVGGRNVVMYNPRILNKTGKYETEEGCLSLNGVRKTVRYKNIEIEYQDEKMQKIRACYSGFVAQIIQHEIDHLEGRVI